MTVNATDQQFSGNARQHPEDDLKIRELLATAIKRSNKSRQQVVDGMNEVLGPNTVSVRMLDDWTAPSKVRVRFPLVYVSAFCEATGCDDLRKILLRPRDRKLFEISLLQFAAQAGWPRY